MVSRPGYERAHTRSRGLRALAGAALTALLVLLVVTALAPMPATAVSSPAASDTPGLSVKELAGRDPLSLSIDDLAPSYIPENGRVEVSGTVTNRTDEPWTNVKVYGTFDAGAAAMRNARQISRAVDSPNDTFIGTRIVEEGQFDTVDELAPGASASYAFRLPASALAVARGGAYWLGAQAIGQADSYPRDPDLADGRARTLIPYVPPRVRTPLPTAITVPLTRSIAYADDGSLSGLTTWDRALSSGGRLSRLLDFVDAAGTEPVTWVVDPAVPDAVSRIARGNPARSIAPTQPDDVDPEQSTPGGGSTEATGGADPEGDPSAAPLEPDPSEAGGDQTGQSGSDELDGQVTDDEAATAQVASTWLERLRGSLTGSDVMTLPYGHVDVPAAVRHDPAILELARAQRSTTLEGWRIRGTPAIASPTGLLDASAVAATDADTISIVSDEALAGDVASAPTVARMGGHRVVVTSSGAAAGGPTPGPALTMTGLRQRLLAEAAVRVIRSDPQPLVVSLPTSWALDGGADFFAGLQVDWLDLDPLSAITSDADPGELAPTDLEYPDELQRREVGGGAFDAIDELIAAGDTLQNVLALNTTVGGEVTEQALSAATYAARGRRGAARASVEGAAAKIGSQLDSVTVDAPNGVTLSSADGSFPATLRNDLSEPVRVEVRARTDEGLEVDGSGPIDIEPGSRFTAILEARATSSRVHNVTLLVSDSDGVPLGATDTLPLRSAQVSNVIWLIMGTGVGLLFLAIAARLVRRVRAARSGEQAA